MKNNKKKHFRLRDFPRVVNKTLEEVKYKKNAFSNVMRGLFTLQMSKEARSRISDPPYYSPTPNINRDILMEMFLFAAEDNWINIWNSHR